MQYKTPYYDHKTHLKFAKNTRTVEQTFKIDKFNKVLEDAENATKVDLGIQNLIQEKYAHDLVILAIMFEIVNNALNSTDKDVKEAKEYLDNLMESDKNIENNLKNYIELKETYKHLKIAEVKLKDSSLSTKDISKVEKQIEQSQYKLDEVAKKINIETAKSKLVFNSAREFLEFNSKFEFESSYREAITDAEALQKIFETPVAKLHALAKETVGDVNNLSAQSSDIQLQSQDVDLKKAMDLATSVSPMPILKS